jgi:hypothetical protein
LNQRLRHHGQPSRSAVLRQAVLCRTLAKLTSNIAPPDSDNLPCFGEDGACDFDLVSKMLRADIAPVNSDGWRLVQRRDNRFWFCFGGLDGDNGCTPDHPNTVRSVTIVEPGIWYHVAGVRSSSSIKIYVNGVLEGAKPSPTMTTDTDTASFLLGRYIPENVFYGSIDEVSVYNRPLSAKEVASIFKAGKTGKCKPKPKVLGAR